MKKPISEISIRRWILYYRYLNELLQQERTKVLSEEIAQYFNLDPSQVRKDFSYIGQLGKRGCGYNVEKLLFDLKKKIRQSQKMEVVLVGCGKLGRALIGYPILQKFNFVVSRGFDIDKKIIGKTVENVPIDSYEKLEEYIQNNKITMAIIAVPSASAKSVFTDLVSMGVQGILNFSPVFLHAGDNKVIVKNVDFSIDFNVLRYQLGERRIK